MYNFKLLNFIEKLTSLINVNKITWENVSNMEEALMLVLESVDRKITGAYEKRVDFAESKSSTTGFEVKMSMLEDQLASKDISLEVLRKKIVEMEEMKFGRSKLRQFN